MRKTRKEERAQAIQELTNSGKGEAAVYVCVVLQHRIPCAFVGVSQARVTQRSQGMLPCP